MQPQTFTGSDYLGWFNSIHPLGERSQNLLEAAWREKSFVKGEQVTREGEVQYDLLLVLEGIHISWFTQDDKLHVMAFAYPPSLSGIPESFLTGKPAAYTLQSHTASRCLSIPREKLDGLFAESREIETLFRKITEAILIGNLSRNYELRAFTMEERFLAFARRSPHLFHLVPHKYLASYLGMDATNFSKLYNKVKI